MAVSASSRANNIWVAAGDGDLDRVKELVEHQSISPNAPDQYTYTPMHAAASYGHIHVLDYLISKGAGGNVNVKDSDGDTPMYTAENIETARYLVDHGAIIDIRNNEGISPLQHLDEEYPEVASYLRGLLPGSNILNSTQRQQQQPSQYQQDIASEDLTTELIASAADIMHRTEGEEQDLDERLRQVVGRTVLESVLSGYQMTEAPNEGSHERPTSRGGGSKKPRTEE